MYVNAISKLLTVTGLLGSGNWRTCPKQRHQKLARNLIRNVNQLRVYQLLTCDDGVGSVPCIGVTFCTVIHKVTRSPFTSNLPGLPEM